ncbi:MAG: imidazole glycerol phosphate synthase subunit HisF, partial [Bacteroidales bacterium]|nr:imidazole glycerol phosphate synthase subunit HisF [Bacteroidales bacterium]
MLAKRIIPCLDIRDGQTVKGINFLDIREVGDPVEMGGEYARAGADELVYLDITATHEGRNLFTNLVRKIAEHVNIPFTVGGGIHDLSDVDPLLNAGADKVSINSAAVKNPDLVGQIARSYGSQFVVVAIDANFEDDDWFVYVNGGRIKTQRRLFEWAREAEDRGAGEILFTSMNHDGTKNGYANEATAELSTGLGIPVIASGGAGKMNHFVDVFGEGEADAALAASIFHFREIGIQDLKTHLRNH